MSKVIYLDPGHGGTDAGAVNGSRRESDDNLKLALLVRDILIRQNQAVLLSRKEDSAVSLDERTRQANRAKADLYVSLHRNSFTSPDANGVEIWIYTTAGRITEAAAVEVLEEVLAVGAQSNRGVKRGNYHVLRESEMPAMLIELGFISNAEDNTLFDRNFEQYAKAIAKGILSALGEAYDDGEPSTPKYKVQVGAFAVEQNAKDFLQSVQDMGLQAFLVTQEETGNE